MGSKSTPYALDNTRGNAIIALRCCKLSGHYEEFWEWRSAIS